MRIQRRAEHLGGPVLFVVGCIMLAFMGLSLAVTSTGTARFATAMGYPLEVGYAVGAVFDLAKALLPVALLVLFARRALVVFAVIGFAWIGLVTYSCLATHATVRTAFASIERLGTWKMEGRTNVKADLAAVERRLAALSQPIPPRPSETIRSALRIESVPPGVWRNSQECQQIRASRYFQKACAKVLELRRELAAAEDYEHLEARGRELTQLLAAAPIVSTSDPLPEAFAATLGRIVPLDGRDGIALLLTIVIEIMSCFGLAALRALGREEGREDQAGLTLTHGRTDQGYVAGMHASRDGSGSDIGLDDPMQIVPRSSLTAQNSGCSAGDSSCRDKRSEHPSNVFPMRQRRLREGRKMIPPHVVPPSRRKGTSLVGSHVPDFAMDRLRSSSGASVLASDVLAAYVNWCASKGCEPLSQQKLGAELTGLGFAKRKSCGLIRYRDLQFVV
ncbi:MAG: hypothetical protein AB7S74_09705 [Hyphomicrobium sp.]